jgi:hypothetical protein
MFDLLDPPTLKAIDGTSALHQEVRKTGADEGEEEVLLVRWL